MTISPFTGWTRRTWEDYADRLLHGAQAFGSPGHARLRLPGVMSTAGRDSDELEGFARTFLMAGFRIAGDPAQSALAEWYAEGLDAGTDPRSPERWPLPAGAVAAQPKVEAASIALVLALTRERLWDRLEERVQRNIVAWLRPIVGAKFPSNNWLWFQLIVESFLRSIGEPTDPRILEAGLRRTEALYRGGGWYADGGDRHFDHYNGWAWHFYPLLWTRLEPSHPLALEHQGLFDERLGAYLRDAVHLVGADGSPLIQGRSLIYRFGAAAPFWMGALTGATDLSPGLLRRAASGIISHFAGSGVPDDRGLLTVGWHCEWPGMRQTYSGAGSPYWASKGMLGLMLPADHPVWTATEEGLPVETADFTRVLDAPGWAVSGTRADGIVRIANHGADLSPRGESAPGHPLYSRIGYSTATFPPPSGADADDPVAQTVSVVGADDPATSRAGFERVAVQGSGGSALASSRHRVRFSAGGHHADPSAAGHVSITSVLRGAWEVRIVHVDGTAPPGLRLRVGGWPLASDTPPIVETGRSAASVVGRTGLRSTARAVGEADRTGVVRDHAGSPLGENIAAPWVWVAARAGAPVVVLLSLGRSEEAGPAVTPQGDGIAIVWSDGMRDLLVPEGRRPAPTWRYAIMSDNPRH